MKKISKHKTLAYESLKDEKGNTIMDIRRIGSFGFPYRPSCMCYSKLLGLLALGTHVGRVVIIGIPGFSLWADLPSSQLSVVYLEFLSVKKKIVAVCQKANTYYVATWFLNDTNSSISLDLEELTELKQNVGTITAVCAGLDYDTLYLGTSKADVHLYSIKGREFNRFALTEEFVLQNYSLKKYYPRLGAVQTVKPNSREHQKMILGYAFGAIIVWDIKGMRVSSFLSKKESLFSACWGAKESMFVTSHAKGLICCWSATKTITAKDIFGNYSPVPFYPREKVPCQSLGKIIWRDSFFLFTGGIPVSIQCERNILSIMTGGTIAAVLEVGSKIIDFLDIPISKESALDLNKKSFFLVILTEQELVVAVIEPSTKEHPLIVKEVAPYHLPPLNASCITTSLLLSSHTDTLYNKLSESGNVEILSLFKKLWPFDGGLRSPNEVGNSQKVLLVTGHEDGNICIWRLFDNKEPCLCYRIRTAELYDIEEVGLNVVDERNASICNLTSIKLGFYDPFCDDPRLSVRKAHICEQSQALVIGGSAGNVLLFKLNQLESVGPLKPTYIECNLMRKYPKFVWNGHEKLRLKDDLKYKPGYYLSAMISMHPAAPISSLSYCFKWGLLAFGSFYGFVLYDCTNKCILYLSCTYDVSGLPTGGENIQRNSFLRSLRNSMRVFSKKSRLEKEKNKNSDMTSRSSQRKLSSESEPFSGLSRSTFVFSTGDSIRSNRRGFAKTTVESLKFEALMEMSTRFVGSKKSDPALKGLIQSIAFVECPMSNTPKVKPMLVVGSNSGKLYIVTLKFQIFERHIAMKSVESSKEIQMKHKAPILSLSMLGQEGADLSLSPLNPAFDSLLPFNHYLLCCTEEQIKILSLQSLKTKMKAKITATAGNRLRKTLIFNVKLTTNKVSRYLAAFSSTGKLLIFSLCNLKCLRTYNTFPKDDVLAISSVNVTPDGFGIYQSSCSEIEVFVLTTRAYLGDKQASSTTNLAIPSRIETNNSFKLSSLKT